MKYSILLSTLFAALGLAACDKPTVVNVPAPVVTPAQTVVVPGPAGPQGATGNTGAEGTKGEPGKPGEGTTVIVTPPPPPPRQ